MVTDFDYGHELEEVESDNRDDKPEYVKGQVASEWRNGRKGPRNFQ